MRRSAEVVNRQVIRLTLHSENPADVLFLTQVLWKLENDPKHAQAFMLRELPVSKPKRKKPRKHNKPLP